MKYTSLIFGFLFFANPYLGPFDLLPDFIGLLLIARAIKAVSDVSPSAEAAIASFKKAAIVSGAQIAIYIPLLTVISTEPSFNLLYSTAFAVLRMVFLIPAFNELFNSLHYFSEKSASNAKFLRPFRIVTIAFTVFHCIFSALPEIVYVKVVMVPNDTGLGYTSYFPLGHFRTGVMVLCAAVVLVVGLFWFVYSVSAINKLKHDKAFNEAIVHDISLAERSAKKTVLKSLNPTAFLLCAAAFTSFTYFVDGRPLIPPYLAPVLHAIAIGYMRNMCLKKVSRGFSIAAAVFGLFLQLASEMFAAVSHEIALFAFEDVKNRFAFVLLFDAIYTVLMILSLIMVCRAVCILIKEHTGLFWENAFITHNAKVGRDKLNQLFSAIALTVLSSLSLLFSFVSYAVIYVHPILNLISVAVSLAIGIAVSSLIASIKTSVTEKYTTDNKMN